MTPLAVALAYAKDFRWHVLPCEWRDDPPRHKRKRPFISRGFYAASNDPAQIEAWWTKFPQALIGVATEPARLAVLDVDVKPGKYGPDSLDELGRSILDDTWIVHTPSGGFHVWYDATGRDIPSTTNRLGPGLDVRARTAYIIAPGAGGYTWDPHKNPEEMPPAEAPDWLIPPLPEPETIASVAPVRPCDGLSPYADAAIALACNAIRQAADGKQRVTLIKEAFTIGTLAGAGGIPSAFARAALIDAGCGMPNYDPHVPWTAKEIARNVDDSFIAGMRRPRPALDRRARR